MKRGTRKKYLLKGLRIDEVSSVAAGANQGAHVSILKTEEDPVTIAKRMFSDILAEMTVTDEMRKLCHEAYKMSDALASSIGSIIRSGDYPNKKAAIKESIQQFVSVMTTMVDDTSIIKGSTESADEGETFLHDDFAYVPDLKKGESWRLRLTNSPGGNPDPINVELAALAISKGFNGQGVVISDEDLVDVKIAITKAWKSTNQDKDLELPENLKINQEEISMKKGVEYFKTLAAMNDEEKAFFEGLPEDEQTEIMKAEAVEERMENLKEKKGKAAPKKVKEKKVIVKVDDETFESDGIIISKSEVGDSVFAFMKAQQVKIDAGAKIIKEEQDKRIKKELEIEAGKLWPNSPASLVEKGVMLKNIRNLPIDDQKAQLSIINAGDIALGKNLVVHGLDNQDLRKSEDRLVTLAKEYNEKYPALSYHQSYKKVLESDEGQEIYMDYDNE